MKNFAKQSIGLGIEVVSKMRIPVLMQWFLCSVLVISAPASADDAKVPSNALEQLQNLEEEAKKIGPWESEAQVITEAHVNIFHQNGWTSEPDRFMLNLINDVSQVAPWNAAQREEIFFNGIQGRYNLGHDQVELVKREMRKETMMVAMKHFKDMVPIALEVAQTRIRKEPFTADQVQKWSHKIEPVMSDALKSVERISQKLEETMSDAQRELLEKDMKAVLKRHRDVEKLVKDWKAGKWNPTHWGLQNDAIHANAMMEHLMQEAEKDGLVNRAIHSKKPDLEKTATDETAWERYVKWFCNSYKCDDKQRGIARSILKSETQKAVNYLSKHQKEIDKAEYLSREAETEQQRKENAARVKTLRKPIGIYFNNLCARLEKSVLTTKQQKLINVEKTQAAQQKATQQTLTKN